MMADNLTCWCPAVSPAKAEAPPAADHKPALAAAASAGGNKIQTGQAAVKPADAQPLQQGAEQALGSRQDVASSPEQAFAREQEEAKDGSQSGQKPDHTAATARAALQQSEALVPGLQPGPVIPRATTPDAQQGPSESMLAPQGLVRPFVMQQGKRQKEGSPRAVTGGDAECPQLGEAVALMMGALQSREEVADPDTLPLACATPTYPGDPSTLGKNSGDHFLPVSGLAWLLLVMDAAVYDIASLAVGWVSTWQLMGSLAVTSFAYFYS